MLLVLISVRALVDPRGHNAIGRILCQRKISMIAAGIEPVAKDKIYGIIVLPVVLYGCENSSLTLREERGLRMFENGVLRKIFGRKRDEVTGEWRKLHNEELNDMYSSPNIVGLINSRRIRWAGHVARVGVGRVQGFGGEA